MLLHLIWSYTSFAYQYAPSLWITDESFTFSMLQLYATLVGYSEMWKALRSLEEKLRETVARVALGDESSMSHRDPLMPKGALSLEASTTTKNCLRKSKSTVDYAFVGLIKGKITVDDQSSCVLCAEGPISGRSLFTNRASCHWDCTSKIWINTDYILHYGLIMVALNAKHNSGGLQQISHAAP